MKPGYLFLFLLVAVALAATLPARSVADSGYSMAFSGVVSDGQIKTYNGCDIVFSIPHNATSVGIEVQSTVATVENVTVVTGDPYYYSTLLLINVVHIYSDGTAYVDIETPASATPTPVPTGTVVTCDTPGQYALAGDTVTFPVVIQNNLGADHTYTLSASSDAGWTTSFEYSSGGQNMNIFQIFVPAGQKKTVNLMVDTSYATSVGSQGITVKVDSSTLGLAVSITSANSSVEVTAQVSSAIASLGSNIYYSISLQNTQSQDNDYKLAVTGLPDGWYYRYVSTQGSTDEMAEAVVPADATKSVFLQILPSQSAQVGDYNFTAVITTPDGVTITRDLSLKLKGSVSMAVTTDQLGYSTSPGKAFDIKVYVTNNGQGDALTNVYPSVSAPSGWTVNTTPSEVNSIQPGSTQVFTVNVLPPANIVANVYAVNIAVKSDQSTSTTSQYQITISTSSIIPYVGGGILLVIIGGLVFMYRKYGRR